MKKRAIVSKAKYTYSEQPGEVCDMVPKAKKLSKKQSKSLISLLKSRIAVAHA